MRGRFLLALTLLACDRSELSDQGQYWTDASIVTRVTDRGGRVLVGSEFQVTITELAIEGELDGQDSLLCATQSASGVLEEFEPDRFRVTDVGPGAVLFAAPSISCPANTDATATLGPDSWSMEGVDGDGLEGRWIPVNDTYLLARRVSPGGRGAFPDVLGKPLEQLRVVADAQFQAVAMLVDPALGEAAEVRYSESQALVDVPAHFADVLEVPEGEPNELNGVMRAGESFTPSFSVLGQTFVLGDVSAVHVESIASLEILPFYSPDDGSQREWGRPGGALAIARNAEGQRVVGPPVEWKVTRGKISADEPPNHEMLLLSDTCPDVRVPKYRSATVEARLGDIVEHVDFEWTALPGDCEHAGCSCSSAGDSQDVIPTALGLLVLLGLRRSQRRTRISSM